MFIRLSILQICLTLAAFAQQGAKPPLPHQLRLLCVDTAKGADKIIVVEKVDDAWVPRWRLKLSASFMTDTIGFSGRNLGIAIDPAPPTTSGAFNGPAQPVSEKIDGLKPFQEFQLTEKGATTAVLVSSSEPEATTTPYRIILFDTNRSRFEAGRVLVQNFTPNEVGGLLGGKKIVVPPGTSAIVEPGVDQPADMAQITLAWNDAGNPRVFCDTRWPAKVEYRRYLLLLPKSDGTIQPFVFPEYPPFP